MSPVYPFRCKTCDAYQEIWLDQPHDWIVGGECIDNRACTMMREWNPPNIGPVDGAGGSPSRIG